jgi:polygalacturonase
MTILKKPLIIVILLVLVQLHLLGQPSITDQAPNEIAPVTTPFGPLHMNRPIFPSRDFDIRAYGAVPGGAHKNTDAIRKAISAASTAGGGRIVVSGGVWLTGPIHLENNINLYLAKDAELRFSQDFEDYLPAVFSRHEDTECYKYSAFVYANGKTNIAITGEGTLNGQGKPWWAWKETKKSSESLVIEMGNKNTPVAERIFD